MLVRYADDFVIFCAPGQGKALRERLEHWLSARGYFHYRHSSRVMGKLNWQVRDRVRRWLWRKHAKKRALWTAYPDERLHGQYGPWPLPEWVGWKRRRDGEPNALS